MYWVEPEVTEVEVRMSNYHVPVMLKECLEGLNINPKGTYVDVTYGGGGHSRAILDALDQDGTLIVFDQDADALRNNIEDKRLLFCEANFRYLENFCSYHNVGQLDGLLADLGVSSYHLDERSRGFSFRFGESDLDMRMNTESEISAKQVLNTYDQPKLAKVLRSYGELDKASMLANAIVDYRGVKEIITTEDLEVAVSKFLNDKTKNKTLAKIYQAGEFINKNLIQAHAWAAQSAINDHVDGNQLKIEIESNLSAEEVSQARRLFAAWQIQ